MKKQNKTRFIIIICIGVLFMIYYFANRSNRADTTKPEETGNANYFNPGDGEYYQDKKYKIRANDNTAYILRLFDSTGKINVPEGNFLCKKQIVLKGKKVTITGVSSKTRIIFSSNALKNVSGESVLINGSHSADYNENSAQSISISGIIFEYKRTSLNSPKTILLLSNVNGIKINKCSFIAELEKSMPVTLLDLYNCCKNVELSKVAFANLTGADSGGSIWVRNLTEAYNNPVNITQNVNIEDCDFKQNTGDEIIAVFSSRGHIKDVKISNCIFNEKSKQNIMALSIYPSENKYTGTIAGVLLQDNTIISEYLNKYLLTIGGEGRKNKVSGITILNNKIEVKAESDDNTEKFIIYKSNKETDIEDVKIVGNTIKTGTLPNTSVICNADEAIENKITGKCKNGIVGGNINKNTIDGADNAILAPDTANGNKLINAVVGIICNKNNSSINKNIIYLNAQKGVCGLKIQSASPYQTKIDCNGNTVYTSQKNQYGLIINGVPDLYSSFNSVVGPGQKVNLWK